MLIITKGQLLIIVESSFAGLPNEACGLLGGRFEGDNRHVEKVYILKNMDNSPEHFAMDPKEQFAAIKDMRQKGWALLGNFHSHPASPSRPSEEDKRLAFDPDASYVIVSLEDKSNPVVKSFRIRDREVEEEEIGIIEEV